MPLSPLALWLLAAAAPPVQQPNPNCLDDRHVDRCADDQQRRQRKLYDAETIDAHAARGDRVRRVFYVDGYGIDTALVSVVRAPGRDIVVEVRTPAAPAGQTLTAAVPLSVWQEIVAESAHFDRALVPLPKAEPDICLHAWVYTAEASDPPEHEQGRPTVRRAVEDACRRGLVQTFALRLADRALELLAPCRAIDPDRHRNAVAVLAACNMLSGDRIAAAQAFNAMEAMRFANDRELTSEFRSGFGHEVLFDIAGQVTEKDWSGAAPFWLEQRQALSGTFFPESVHGERWDRVLVRGHLWRQAEDGSGRARAPTEILLTWQPSQTFQIRQIKVGAFAPAR